MTPKGEEFKGSWGVQRDPDLTARMEGEQGSGREERKDRERRGWGKWEEKEVVEIGEFPQVSDPTL